MEHEFESFHQHSVKNRVIEYGFAYSSNFGSKVYQRSGLYSISVAVYVPSVLRSIVYQRSDLLSLKFFILHF